ncbi:MAG: glutamine-hydrolyzing carbamoyl-phosphate synthase small subunit [Candidatus Omnitrophica bacterium]|nr:glutamine-hydrolyzing carbamoyl-phosphate synthase small subunit [Candidatus Omnitrophota bacterium]MCM8826529.1 glutamine-hydrolyzing carbamoyl-phosphate synthase small subunit [Candidatus Omnitrophota bacterium]
MKAILMLEDKTTFFGEAKNKGEIIGEIIFNTAVVGYQEILTDPANYGKILVLTYPLIGNYGCNYKFNESKKVWVKALVIKEMSRIYSNWQAELSLDEFADKEGLFILNNVDVRSLMVYLREKGSMYGIISTDEFREKVLINKIEEFKSRPKKSVLKEISIDKPKIFKGKNQTKIAILDLGITNSILTQLKNLGVTFTILPFNISSKDILKYNPAGIIISSGPEDDVGLKEVVGNVRDLIGTMPILGISTGCQVLALSKGVKVRKMRLGHRGVNYPIKRPNSLQGEITVQNHSYVIDRDGLEKNNINITAFNLNDDTVEEIESKEYKFIGTQYLPLSGGFDEINPVLIRFIQLIERS